MKFSLQTKSHLVFNSIALLTLFLGLQLTNVRAQSAGFEAGLAGQMSNVLGNGILNNANSVNAVAVAARNRGLAKIKSGRATTTFVHSPNVYKYMLTLITWDADEPQTEAGQIKYLQSQVSRFEARMMKAGNYRLNDNADAAIFACILSYQAQYDETQLTPAQLEIFRQIHKEGRQSDLNSVDYQGAPELEKEQAYIWDAMMSIQAIEWREKARVARTSTERQEAEEKAKHYATRKMERFSDEQLRELLQAGKQ